MLLFSQSYFRANNWNYLNQKYSKVKIGCPHIRTQYFIGRIQNADHDPQTDNSGSSWTRPDPITQQPDDFAVSDESYLCCPYPIKSLKRFSNLNYWVVGFHWKMESGKWKTTNTNSHLAEFVRTVICFFFIWKDGYMWVAKSKVLPIVKDWHCAVRCSLGNMRRTSSSSSCQYSHHTACESVTTNLSLKNKK